MSVAVVICAPRSCSGAAYCGVRARWPSAVSAAPSAPSSSSLAMPKSSSFTSPSAPTRMLPGLMSRWTTRWLWACATAARTSSKSARRRSTSSRCASQYEIDGQARDEIEHEVRLSAGGHAGIEQARDVRVRQPREDGALALEPRPGGMADQRQVQQLDGHDAADALVGAARAPHAAAAALAEQRLDDVGADRACLRATTRPAAACVPRRAQAYPGSSPRRRGLSGGRGLRARRPPWHPPIAAPRCAPRDRPGPGRAARRAGGSTVSTPPGRWVSWRRPGSQRREGANPRPLALGSPVGGGA